MAEQISRWGITANSTICLRLFYQNLAHRYVPTEDRQRSTKSS